MAPPVTAVIMRLDYGRLLDRIAACIQFKHSLEGTRDCFHLILGRCSVFTFHTSIRLFFLKWHVRWTNLLLIPWIISYLTMLKANFSSIRWPKILCIVVFLTVALFVLSFNSFFNHENKTTVNSYQSDPSVHSLCSA